jgi:hypothetical protein
MLFSLGLLWNCYSAMRRSGRPNLSTVSKGPQLLIALLDSGQIFTLVSRCQFPSGSYGIALGDEEVLSAKLE